MMRDVLARMVKAGIGRQTNIVRSYLHAAFVHGAHADLDPRRAAEQASSFRLLSNPMHLLPRIAEFEATRDRVLADGELRALWLTLEERRGEVASTVRCLILLGGQRVAQLLRATWADYDRQAQTLRLTDPKGKRARAVEHVLPVSAWVTQQLSELAVVNSSGDFIFSATAGTKPIHHTTISTVIGEIAKLGDAPGARYRPGDIRRSVETRLQALGVSRDVRAQLLSHGRSSGVQARHYERHDYLPEKRAALKIWEQHLAGVLRKARTRSSSSAPTTAAKQAARRPALQPA
jgi:integrase